MDAVAEFSTLRKLAQGPCVADEAVYDVPERAIRWSAGVARPVRQSQRRSAN
jgi:hypothetical protein